MIIDCIADLHGHYPELKGGDLLIVAGDFCRNAHSSSEQLEFISWIQKQEYKRIIFVAGNHDTWLEGVTHQFEFLSHLTYLCDSGTEFETLEDQECNWCKTPREGSPWIKCSHTTICPLKITKKVKIWGSPWTKTFDGMNPKCKAFTFDTDEGLEEKWKLIPNDIDILVTHSPPYGFLDEVDSQQHCTSYHVGSRSLLKRVCEIRPQLHVFGHIHEGYGEDIVRDWKRLKIEESAITQDIKDVVFVNASYVNEYYEPVNKPIRIII